jgi:hypothetical protein
MVYSNIYQRTFFIKYDRYNGTAFTFERDGVQYLASTGHTFPYVTNGQQIQYFIYRNNNWIEMEGYIYLHPNSQVDICIISLPRDISQRHPIILTSVGMALSMDVYFLGFPYGRFMDVAQPVNSGYPIPYVKKGIISSFSVIDGVEIIFLDGMNNPGFSGGPCIYMKRNTTIPVVIGIIKGYVPNEIQFNSPLGPITYNENSGIVDVQSIKYLDDIII